MATVIFDLRTRYRRGEIHHLDVALIHRTDTSLNMYTIIPRVPDTAPGMDLTDPLRVARFDNVPQEQWYSYVFRMYLNIEPHIEIRSASFNTGSPICRGSAFWRRCSPNVIPATVLITER